MTDAAQRVEAYLDALVKQDFDRVRSCLADTGFVYTSPIGNYDDADQFVGDMSKLGSILQAIHIRKLAADGNEVLALVDISVALHDYITRSASMLCVVEDDRIKSMESLFDASDYHKMFEQAD